MLTDLIFSLFKALFYTAAAVAGLLCLPFVVAHVIDNRDAPEYPHSGFCPDCPAWEEPENTLPPTYSLAAGEEF